MKFFTRLFTAAAILVVAAVTAAELDDLRGLSLENAKIPVYRTGSEKEETSKPLQMMVFLRAAGRDGQLLRGQDVVLELIRRDADPDSIRDNWRNAPPYLLGAGLADIADFWTLDRLAYSEGVLFSPECSVDPLNRNARGVREVYFRSPQLDLDGVGFLAEFDRRRIQVNSDVRIVIRTEENDPRRFLVEGKIPPAHSPVTASADSLLIDMANNQIMLVGSVRISEEHGTLECDRFSIFLGETDAAVPRAEGNFVYSGVTGVLADGDVRITRDGPESDMITAEHMEYTLADGVVNFSGEEKPPEIIRPNGDRLSGRSILIIRPEQRIVIPEECRIDISGDDGGRRIVTADRGEFSVVENRGELRGNVKINDETMLLECGRLNVKLLGEAGNSAAADSDPFTLIGADSSKVAQGVRELETACCFDGVKLTGKVNGETLRADYAELRYPERVIDLTGGVEAEDAVMRLNCDKMRITFQEKSSGSREIDHIAASGNLKIVGHNAPSEDTRMRLRGETTLTAQAGEFDFPGNYLEFSGDVKVFDRQSSLAGDRLEIFLADRTDGGESGGVAFAGNAARGKLPVKAVMTGNVVMLDPGAELETGRLTMFFSPLPPGMVPEPGMIQSGGVRLTAIECDGGMIAETRPPAGGVPPEDDSEPQAGFGGGELFSTSSAKRTLNAERGRIDLLENLSEFHGDVKVSDEQGKLECDSLYLYAVPDQSEVQEVAAAPDPDADPFELESFSEATAPSKIALGNNMQLERVVCRDRVKLTRNSPDGKLQQAGGELGEYLVAGQIMTITGTPESRAWLREDEFRRECEKLIYHLDQERFEVIDRKPSPAGNIASPAGAAGSAGMTK